MADDKKQLVLDILANAKTKAGTDKAARDLEDVADAADEVSKSNDRLGKSTDDVAGKQKKLSSGAQEFQGRMESLNREIGLSKHELDGLHKSYADTADITERKDLGKGIRKLEADLRKLEKTRTSVLSSGKNKGFLDELFPDLEGAGSKAGAEAGKLASSLSEALGPAAIGAAAGMAPVVGGIISAAVVGSAGGLGVIGGIALAVRNPAVKSSGKILADHLLSSLTDEAAVFIRPVLSELAKTGDFFDKTLAPQLSKLFSNSAKLVAPLASGIRQAVGYITTGLANAAGKAGPVITVLATRLAGIGDAIGDAFTQFGKDGAASAAALDAGLKAVEGTIRIVAGGISILTKAYGFLAKIGAFGTDAQVAYLSALAESGGAAEDATSGLSKVFADAAGSSGKAAAAYDDQRKALVDLTNEERAQSDPVYAMISAQQKLTEAQKAVNDAIHKHGVNSKEAQAASADLVGAVEDLQGAAGALGGSFSGELTPQMEATFRAAGLTTGQINSVKAAFREAKKAGDSYAKTYRAKIITDYINNVYQNFLGAANSGYEAEKKRLAHRATGGPTVRGEAYIVGENGPEVWSSDSSGRILSAAASRGLAANAAKAGTPMGGGGGNWDGTLKVAGNADTKVASFINYLIRTGMVST